MSLIYTRAFSGIYQMIPNDDTPKIPKFEALSSRATVRLIVVKLPAYTQRNLLEILLILLIIGTVNY